MIRPYGVSTAIASTYTAEAWAVEEAAGAVFLPAAGRRINQKVQAVGSYAYYWTATQNYNGSQDKPLAYTIQCGEYAQIDFPSRNPIEGNAVRLVKDVN